MSKVEIYIVVEGQTEQTFVREILAPYMGQSGIYLHPSIVRLHWEQKFPGSVRGSIGFSFHYYLLSYNLSWLNKDIKKKVKRVGGLWEMEIKRLRCSKKKINLVLEGPRSVA